MYSLFQIMTRESWSMGIVRPVMEQFPLAWAFFVPFILISSFTVLNLFIAIIVDSMQSMHAESEAHQTDDTRDLKSDLGELRTEIAALRAALERRPEQPPGAADSGP